MIFAKCIWLFNNTSGRSKLVFTLYSMFFDLLIFEMETFIMECTWSVAFNYVMSKLDSSACRAICREA